MLAECEVAPAIFERVVPRWEQLMEPFVVSLGRRERAEQALTFVQGLLSDLSHKNVESIAYRFGQERLPLQNFVGTSEWDEGVLRDELARQIGRARGTPDGILVFDPSGFPKSGRESVGVARQWCGRLGKTDNCQVAVFLGYVSRHEHALIDRRLDLPREWTDAPARMKKAGVPKGTKFRTRHERVLELLARHGQTRPHQWITGDDERGRPSWFRRDLRALHVAPHPSPLDPRAVRAGFAGICGRCTSNACSPCRATPRSAISKWNRPPEPASVALRSVRGRASRRGHRLNQRRPGPRAMCATARRDRSSWRCGSAASAPATTNAQSLPRTRCSS